MWYCYSGYGVINGGCRKCSDTNCATCDGDAYKCGYCISGYGVVNGGCRKCSDAHCAVCNNNVYTCTKCQTGYKLQNGSCYVDNLLEQWFYSKKFSIIQPIFSYFFKMISDYTLST